jgi:hypothetical protein
VNYPIRLKLLLQQRHWQTYRTFCRQYDKVAETLDPCLVGTWPSRAQLHRWLSGNMKGLPYPDHCRILEAMFPTFSATELFEVTDSSSLSSEEQTSSASLATTNRSNENLSTVATNDRESLLLDNQRFADVDAVYATRTQFTSCVPPHTIFDGAQDIRVAGLSLNILCQQYADDSLRNLIATGSTVRCLFLRPYGVAIQAREFEEGQDPGHLSSLTEINIQTLLRRVRKRLPEDCRDRLMIATYDETIRYNITLVDNTLGIVQPYLHTNRGLEAPTLVLRRRDDIPGLFTVFDEIFSWLWERSEQL